jgi:hypothetical protein
LRNLKFYYIISSYIISYKTRVKYPISPYNYKAYRLSERTELGSTLDQTWIDPRLTLAILSDLILDRSGIDPAGIIAKPALDCK